MKNKSVRIGSRGSELALWQARWVAGELVRRHRGLDVSVSVIRTKGDKILDSPLSAMGDKGLFTREIEHALLRGEIDIAVHSLKDLPTALPDGLALGAICRREDVRDVFIPHPSNPVRTLVDQPRGATIATGSLRRKCQLLSFRSDFAIADIRGNLNTRLAKLDQSSWEGMVLAKAGVVRLGWESRIGETIEPEVILPAVGQGALAVETRSDDRRIAGLVKPLEHEPTRRAAEAERALLAGLQGGCQVPIGAYARIELDARGDRTLTLSAMVGSLDGTAIVRGRTHGTPEDAGMLGGRLADTLRQAGAGKILDEIRQSAPAGVADVEA